MKNEHLLGLLTGCAGLLFTVTGAFVHQSLAETQRQFEEKQKQIDQSANLIERIAQTQQQRGEWLARVDAELGFLRKASAENGRKLDQVISILLEERRAKWQEKRG